MGGIEGGGTEGRGVGAGGRWPTSRRSHWNPSKTRTFVFKLWKLQSWRQTEETRR